MTEAIKKKLKQLSELDAQREIIRLNKQKAIDSILTDKIRAQRFAIDTEFDLLIDAINDTVKVIEAEIKTAALAHGKTVKGSYMAVYSKGRVSWNTKALDGYAAAHPEIKQFKKIGNYRLASLESNGSITNQCSRPKKRAADFKRSGGGSHRI